MLCYVITKPHVYSRWTQLQMSADIDFSFKYQAFDALQTGVSLRVRPPPTTLRHLDFWRSKTFLTG